MLSLTMNPRGPYQPSCPTAQRILSSGEEEPGNETCEGQGRLTTHVGEPWEDAGTLPGAMPYPLQAGSRGLEGGEAGSELAGEQPHRPDLLTPRTATTLCMCRC